MGSMQIVIFIVIPIFTVLFIGGMIVLGVWLFKKQEKYKAIIRAEAMAKEFDDKDKRNAKIVEQQKEIEKLKKEKSKK